MGCSAAAMEPKQAPFASQYSLGEQLSTGRFATVHGVQRRCGNHHRRLAAKVLAHSGASAPRAVTLWRLAGDHPNVLKLEFCIYEQTPVSRVFLMSKLCLGSLNEKAVAEMMQHEAHFGRIALGMCAGVGHLHSVDLLHRDLSPEHFLLESDFTVKVCGFSSAVLLPRSGLVTGLAGSELHRSPEMLRGEAYGRPADAWAMGVTCKQLMLRFAKGAAGTDSEKIAQEMDPFLSQLLVVNPIHRAPVSVDLCNELVVLYDSCASTACPNDSVEENDEDDWIRDLPIMHDHVRTERGLQAER